MDRSSLRFRMMVSFTTLVGLLLTGAYLASYLFFSHIVRAQLDERLLGEARPVLAELIPDPSEEKFERSDAPFEDDVTKLNIPGEYFVLLDASGNLILESANLRSKELQLGTAQLDRSHETFHSLKNSKLGNLRAVSLPFQRANATYFLVVAMPNKEAEQALFSFRAMILSLLPISVLVTGLLSIWYVGRSLRPISELTRHAIDMSSRFQNAESREIWTPLLVKNPNDELGQLSQAFNNLFQKFDSVVRQLRQFVSDASHELRTPLTVLRGETELLLSKPRTEQEYCSALSAIDEELNTLVRIVKSLFTLSLADAGQLKLGKEFLYLNEVLEESCALAQPLATAKQIRIIRELNRDIPFTGDETFLRQLFVIFLDNAIKYSRPGQDIRVSASTELGSVHIRFQDTGVGIAAEHLPGIFQRFNRGAQTGSTEGQSGGLGLPIAQAIARAHGGSICCQSVLERGSVFTVTLPLSNGVLADGPQVAAR
jgi:two-component system OmpR family sensor kinase